MQNEKSKRLAERLKKFALNCAKLAAMLPKTKQNLIYGDQLIRSSASPGANYAEALCAITRKDFTYDINKCRKELNESVYWLELILFANPPLTNEFQSLLKEGEELTRIFQKSSMTLRKAQLNKKSVASNKKMRNEI